MGESYPVLEPQVLLLLLLLLLLLPLPLVLFLVTSPLARRVNLRRRNNVLRGWGSNTNTCPRLHAGVLLLSASARAPNTGGGGRTGASAATAATAAENSPVHSAIAIASRREGLARFLRGFRGTGGVSCSSSRALVEIGSPAFRPGLVIVRCPALYTTVCGKDRSYGL